MSLTRPGEKRLAKGASLDQSRASDGFVCQGGSSCAAGLGQTDRDLGDGVGQSEEDLSGDEGVVAAVVEMAGPVLAVAQPLRSSPQPHLLEPRSSRR